VKKETHIRNIKHNASEVNSYFLMRRRMKFVYAMPNATNYSLFYRDRFFQQRDSDFLMPCTAISPLPLTSHMISTIAGFILLSKQISHFSAPEIQQEKMARF
jgi:hypothetical protein